MERERDNNKNKNIEQEQRHGGPAGYLGIRARVQNQRLCHWGRSIGGDLRSVSGASSSSGRGGGSGGLQGREKHNTQSLSPPHPHLQSTTASLLATHLLM